MEQYDFLKASCNAFDNGNEAEAKRLATTVRILCHDTAKSVSLLKQLKIKAIDFYDTAPPYDQRYLGWTPLIRSIDSSSPLVKSQELPILDADRAKWHPFDKWWKAVVLTHTKNTPTGKEAILTRRTLVMGLANQDGGAHIDPVLDETYAHITRPSGLGWSEGYIGPEGSFFQQTTTRFDLITMRQIAHEVIRTLESISCRR